MPTKPKVPCKHPSCAALVPSGTKYCERHKAMHPEEIRSAGSRGYNSRWQKARARFLHEHPLCVRCLAEGVYQAATVVDHIVPHRGDQKLFWDESNWQPLCKHHHDQKTGRMDQLQPYRY